MIGVLVTFALGEGFDEGKVRAIADGARAKFERMPGLRSKAFAFDAGRREAVNFYVWDSDDAARAFFTEAFAEQVRGVYGVRPSVRWLPLATLVDNARA